MSTYPRVYTFSAPLRSTLMQAREEVRALNGVSVTPMYLALAVARCAPESAWRVLAQGRSTRGALLTELSCAASDRYGTGLAASGDADYTEDARNVLAGAMHAARVYAHERVGVGDLLHGILAPFTAHDDPALAHPAAAHLGAHAMTAETIEAAYAALEDSARPG